MVNDLGECVDRWVCEYLSYKKKTRHPNCNWSEVKDIILRKVSCMRYQAILFSRI